MKYDLAFGYFGWIGIDLYICFDVLGFTVTVCRFQILMLFVLLGSFLLALTHFFSLAFHQCLFPKKVVIIYALLFVIFL